MATGFASPSNIAQLIELLQEIDENESEYGISMWAVDAQFEPHNPRTPYRIDVRLTFGWVGTKSRRQTSARARALSEVSKESNSG